MRQAAAAHQQLYGRMAASEEEEAEEAEQERLNVALFATQCVEDLGLFFDRYVTVAENKEEKKKKKKKVQKVNQKKKQPQKVASCSGTDAIRSRSSNKDNLMTIVRSAHENKTTKRELWSADTELFLWNIPAKLKDHYERHLSALVPLHPSVLQEDNIRFALLGTNPYLPSERMKDLPLMFNVNAAMACGMHAANNPLNFCCSLNSFWLYLVRCVGAASRLLGDKQREMEFMMRARHHLEHLFDSNHMKVAEGLVCMAYYSFCQVR